MCSSDLVLDVLEMLLMQAMLQRVVGDTIGDPFKDTSGPSLNILIKLMSIVSVVIAGLL